ncbi:uncharacterized protein PV09_01972 [Verruconis gallopava]|uniref:glucan 1,4-alpha-glucosidase n=1 Tax=Verruconis gallopava TaxID=253628 RepID=A0A0D2AJP3_9PEZI|nr:uncharacterized protein PV09_01972 [Verruconis gallopava]KIW07088.1 hypothetical protein PV09_01972 [Verruconis gallopava]
MLFQLLTAQSGLLRDEVIYSAVLPTKVYYAWTCLVMFCCRALHTVSVYLSLWTALSHAQDAPVPSPYAQPSGLTEDITQWLAVSAGSQIATCKTRMMANINPVGGANGTVVASTSTENPNYHYNWVRDAALTMDVVVKLYSAASDANARSGYEQILFQYAQARADEQNDPDLQTGLGEPKFELNNSVFTGPWGRPQNDGPAESATTLMEFASAYLAAGGDMGTVKQKIWDSSNFSNQAPVLKDLLYVASNWSADSFDLWEEEESPNHFFNRMVYHRALDMGAKFAANLSDTETANTLSAAARDVAATLPSFWDPARQLIVYEIGPVLRNKSSYKDVAVVLGILHGYNYDGIYSYANDQVLASAYQLATSFLAVYPIANVTTDASGGTLGIPVGRYPEDVYTGTGTAPNGGNPWFLATAALAELLYRASAELQENGTLTVSNTSLPFWQYFAPAAGLAAGQTYSSNSQAFGTAIAAIEGWADAFVRRIKFHTPADKRLSEEYNRDDGFSTGALDLTWSYASLLTASFARADLRGDTGYIGAVADLV